MLRILFICTGNSCRSQMAEGWARKLKAGLIEPYSAGIETHGLHPDAIRVMAEVGVEISGQRSKLVGELRGIDFDFIVTLSDRARKLCPTFWKGVGAMHCGLESPPRLAAGAMTEEERLVPYRQVRDVIQTFVESLPELFSQHSIAGNMKNAKRQSQRVGV
jgi:arsenate reductase